MIILGCLILYRIFGEKVRAFETFSWETIKIILNSVGSQWSKISILIKHLRESKRGEMI